MKLAYLLAYCGLLVGLFGCMKAAEQRATNNGLPIVHAAAGEQAVIPWALNTRCAINSKNLPTREPEIRT